MAAAGEFAKINHGIVYYNMYFQGICYSRNNGECLCHWEEAEAPVPAECSAARIMRLQLVHESAWLQWGGHEVGL